MQVNLDGLEFVKLALQFGIVPLILGVWNLNKTITDLTITLHRDFVRKSDLKEHE